MKTTLKNAISSIAQHEASHAVAWWACGHAVKSARVFIDGNDVRGDVQHAICADSFRFSHRICTLMAGPLSSQFAKPLRVRNVGFYGAAPTGLGRTRHDNYIVMPPVSTPTDDMSLVELTLSCLPEHKRSTTFIRGVELARLALFTNQDLMHRLAQRLLNHGELNSIDMSDLRAKVIRVNI